jgi:hypothetical protein
MSVRKYAGRKEERKENGRARGRHDRDEMRRSGDKGIFHGRRGQSPTGWGERGFEPRVLAQPCRKGGETSANERWLRRASRTTCGDARPGESGRSACVCGAAHMLFSATSTAIYSPWRTHLELDAIRERS